MWQGGPGMAKESRGPGEPGPRGPVKKALGDPRRPQEAPAAELPNSSPEASYPCDFMPVSYPASYLSRLAHRPIRFGSYDGRRCHTPVSYPGLAACGFIPLVSYPGFIPVPCRTRHKPASDPRHLWPYTIYKYNMI